MVCLGSWAGIKRTDKGAIDSRLSGVPFARAALHARAAMDLGVGDDASEALSTSGIRLSGSLSTSNNAFVEGESLDSDDDDDAAREVPIDGDTDTEGTELSLEDATRNLRKLHVLRDHSEEFYALLHATLVAVPLQCKTNACHGECHVCLLTHARQTSNRTRRSPSWPPLWCPM